MTSKVNRASGSCCHTCACCVENEVIGPHRGRGPARRVAGVGEPCSIRVEFFFVHFVPGHIVDGRTGFRLIA
jgi:hypothetical protein